MANNKRSYREVLGEQLRAFREQRGLSAYKVAQKGKIRMEQVKNIELGENNYTIDIFLGYISGCDLHMFFAEKDNKEDVNDFDELARKGIINHPDNI